MNYVIRPDTDLSDATGLRLKPLLTEIKGKPISPSDAEYEEARTLANNNWDHRPALIIRVADARDVALTLLFAQKEGVEIAVRSGGHSTCGHGSCPGGIVIDLRDLNALEFAQDQSWAWAGAGLTAGEVTAEVEQRKLIIGFGDAATVGIGGLTLGGGIGYMVRKHGLTIDSVLAFEVVTAAGEVLIADADNHPDLFWALRGGGGNFGVVTRFKYRLNPLPAFTGGPLILPVTPETLTGFVAAAEAAPDELSTIAMVMPAPPMPFLPPEIVGKTVLMGMMAFAGPTDQAEKALAPFRALAKPIADLVGPAPYSSMYMPDDPMLHQSVSIRTTFMDKVTTAQAENMLELIEDSEAPLRMIQVRVMGGAAARIAPEATAFAHRQRKIMTVFLAIDSPETLARNEEWVSRCLKELGDNALGAYVNFLADEGAQRIRHAYPEATWNRLRQIKHRYDPDNIFRLNQNIPPAV
ncbi:FAD-binding oxidoreductase [Nitratireductor kimnyeongensis]|uniref:FAD-binding oxidoreductase n=1 Tax=Nitratireductor kimnyeongensis TaxID=430679 RepID=A0ABW0T9L4_9HYPH|nr:FAD-binding oxidoreductase [Nitratireductor kimnyeongensis]QZZ36204.1 FAD-binding oxidoreductase [Nitratireductor kimnyeongensis]